MKLINLNKTLGLSKKLLKTGNCYFATKNLKIPSIAESIEEVTVFRYLKQEGEYVEKYDEILEVETHKDNFKVRADEAGVIVKFLVDVEADYDIGAEYVTIDVDAKPADGAKVDTPAKEAPKEQTPQQPKEEAKPAPTPPPQTSKPTPQPEQTTPVSANERVETREKMSRLRKTVASRLKESQNTYAQVTTFQECDMGDIMKLRKEIGEEFLKKKGIKLGFMSFFVKAVTQSLLERPIVNSVIDSSTEEILHRNFVDISVAVSGPKGLVVPVLRDCQNRTFAQVENGIIDLATKAKEGQLTIEDMSGGTFTISNGGVFGSMLSAPIINPPQSAILGMHNIVNRPVVRNGQIVARPVMYLSMSYDHRLLDGREGASFLKRVADLVEDPRRLLLEL